MEPRRPEDPQIRIRAPLTLLISITLLGSVALYAVGRGRWSFGETLYMTINAVSTVGYRELEGMAQVRGSYAIRMSAPLSITPSSS